MTYVIEILTLTKRKQKFRIDAKDEEEAKERLKHRLPPSQREEVSIESITIDTSTTELNEAYGSFGEE